MQSSNPTAAAERQIFPIQGGDTHGRGQGAVCKAIYMRAYEVYCHVYGEQKALIEGGCRGGFGKGELVAFLYASGFPREEWKMRVNEAFDNLKI